MLESRAWGWEQCWAGGGTSLIGRRRRKAREGSRGDEWSLEEECLMTLMFQVRQEMRSAAYTRGLLEGFIESTYKF